MPEEQAEIKLGELLVAVGVVSSGDLQEAIQIGRRMNLPIGRVLIMSGLVSEINLHSALEAQSLVRDGLIELKTASGALKHACQSGKSLKETLKEMQWAPLKDVQSNKLGELLLEAGIITPFQLEAALYVSTETGMPLGGTLVMQGSLSSQLLPTILDAQESIRQGKLNRSQAVESLKANFEFFARTIGSEHKEEAKNVTTSSVRSSILTSNLSEPEPAKASEWVLIDLLVASGLCDENQLERVVRAAWQNLELSKQMILNAKLLDRADLDVALHCYQLLLKGVINEEQASKALQTCRAKGLGLVQALHEMGVVLPIK
ncbi:MAG: hypothetical protein K2W82_04440 [Candidatus Obscuribacterales bacterium]|nr:hypothetical protein [Candidatus Obscuribacterales bacterium]